jgi:hypothetical protein
MYDHSQVTGSGIEMSLQKRRAYKRELILMKLAGFWRTIIRSSLGDATYPYSQYMRILSFRLLGDMLKDSNFHTAVSE